MVTFVFFIDSVSFLYLRTLSDLHWPYHRTIGKKKEKKTFIWKFKLWLLKKTTAQRGSWTQNLQPTRKCALETPADNVQVVTCPWLSLTPSQASSLHMACGLSDVAWYFICYIFFCTKCKPWTGQVLGTLWWPLKWFLRRPWLITGNPVCFLSDLPSSFLLHPSVHLFSHSSSTDSSLLLTSVNSWE